MNLGSLTNTCNTLAEESFSSAQVVEFVNDCVARINIEVGANFPFFSSTNSEDYTGFPEKWQRSLFIPFVVGRMKQVDSSQFEYNDSYSEFTSSLATFKMKYTVPDEYKDTTEQLSFAPDYTGNPWGWN
jgi:hypothetical protein